MGKMIHDLMKFGWVVLYLSVTTGIEASNIAMISMTPSLTVVALKM